MNKFLILLFDIVLVLSAVSVVAGFGVLMDNHHINSIGLDALAQRIYDRQKVTDREVGIPMIVCGFLVLIIFGIYLNTKKK